MNGWESVLLDKNLPNPIPAPPFCNDIDSKLGFIDREKEEEELIKRVKKAKIENKGLFIVVLGDQGKGKTTFLKNFKKKYSYPKSEIFYVFINFPFELDELNFRYIYKFFLKELFYNEVLINAQEEIFKRIKDIYPKKPETEEELSKLLEEIKLHLIKFPETIRNYPKIVSFIISSTPPSPYYLYFYNFFVHDEEIPKHIPYSNFVESLNEEDAKTKLKNLSEFLKSLLNINHIVIIVDDFDIYERNEKIYKSLYRILLGFRNDSVILKNFSLIISGSATFYQEFFESLSLNERGRIENWSYEIHIDSLDNESFVNLIKSAFINYWNNFLNEGDLPPDNIFGIFTKDTLKFLYEYNNKDLRETLRNIYDLIEKMRDSEIITNYDDIKKIIKEFKKDKIGLKDIEFDYFRKDLERRVKEEKSSIFINQRLTKIFNHLKKHLENNKIYLEAKSEVKISNFYADILLKISKENQPPFEVIFEVKMKDDKVNSEDIRSRIEILKERPNSYLYWITKSHLDDVIIKIESIKDRILNEKALNETQLAYLSYLINLPEIYDLDKEFNFENMIKLLKQSGIDFDLLLNLESFQPIDLIYKEIENILIEQSQVKTYITKDKIFKTLIDKGFVEFSKEYIYSLINEISKKLNFKPTQDTVRFKIKEI